MSETWLEGLNPVAVEEYPFERTGHKMAVVLSPDTIVEAAKRIKEAGYFLEDVTALDVAEGFAVIYHFDNMDTPGRVTFRVIVPHNNPKVPSVSQVFSGADWHERETMDFFGIKFTGHQNLIPILLPPDAEFHPLVKDSKKRLPLNDLVAPPQEEEAEEEAEESKPEAE